MDVKAAARRLRVNESRVRQLLNAGDLSGRRVGGSWLIEAEDVARLEARRSVPGRPLGPARAWGLLDLLEGGTAPWLSSSARSQLRSSIKKLAGSDPDRWRAALRGRREVRRCQAHPAAVRRLRESDDVLPTGAETAALRGFDLVVSREAVEHLYVKREAWPLLSMELAIREVPRQHNLIVLLPNLIWPFDGVAQVPDAVLAADLLESAEARAVRAGADRLNDLAERRYR